VTYGDVPRLALGALFVGAGVLHLVRPDVYLVAMPPDLPAPRALVLLSGVAEVAGGVGLWLPEGRWRRRAGVGLVALLVAVYPANVHMAMAGVGGPAWALWARLPLQGVLVAWALRSSGALGGAGGYSTVANVPGQASRARSRSAGA
jgi:uncharacterized membrane protein